MTRMLPQDSELVRTVSALLRAQGFSLSSLDLADDGGRLLLAENELFVLGLGVTATLDDLLALHPIAASALIEVVHDRAVGAKQWDVYLVLLTPEEIPEDGEAFQRLAAINYDTSGVRRIARAGVGADVDSIETAMRTFLPLPQSLDETQLPDPLDQLEDEIALQGVSGEDSARAIRVFRLTRSLQDV